MKIFKYKFLANNNGIAIVNLPYGAKILSIQPEYDSSQLTQHPEWHSLEYIDRELLMWCVVNENETNYTPRTIKEVGTGDDYPEDGTYITTIQFPHNNLVWHYFDMG